MPQTARGSNYRFVFGKQAAEGTAQTTPQFEVNLHGGSIRPVNSEAAFDVTDVNDTPAGYWIESASAEGNPMMNSDPDAVMEPWYLHLGASADTGAGPYTHTITRSSTKTFCTCYILRPGIPGGAASLWARLVDGFVRGITVTAEKGQTLRHELDIIGKTSDFNATAPSAATNDRRIGATSEKRLTMIGATLKMDIAVTPAVTQVRNLDKVTISSAYAGAAWQQTDELTPRFLDLGEYSCGFTAEGYLQDYTALAATYYGSATVTANMALSPIMVTGSVDFLFPIGPTADATKTLQIQLPSQRITVTPMEPDTGGGAVRVAFSGKLFTPSSGEAITVVVKNAIAAP